MPYSGQISVAARSDDTRCTWSGTSRTYLNGMAHAAEACAPPFRAGQDRPDLDADCCCMGQMPPLADRITLCGWKVRGERACSARAVPFLSAGAERHHKARSACNSWFSRAPPASRPWGADLHASAGRRPSARVELWPYIASLLWGASAPAGAHCARAADSAQLRWSRSGRRVDYAIGVLS